MNRAGSLETALASVLAHTCNACNTRLQMVNPRRLIKTKARFANALLGI